MPPVGACHRDKPRYQASSTSCRGVCHTVCVSNVSCNAHVYYAVVPLPAECASSTTSSAIGNGPMAQAVWHRSPAACLQKGLPDAAEAPSPPAVVPVL